MTARPFDLKAALSGEPVTWEPYSASYVVGLYTFDRYDVGAKFPLVFRNGDGYFTASLDGQAYGGQRVVMAPRKVKRTVWVNLYRTDKSHWSGVFSQWKTEHDAKQCSSSENAVAIAVPVEIEVAE